jgi:hypothetical protein
MSILLIFKSEYEEIVDDVPVKSTSRSSRPRYALVAFQISPASSCGEAGRFGSATMIQHSTRKRSRRDHCSCILYRKDERALEFAFLTDIVEFVFSYTRGKRVSFHKAIFIFSNTE